MMAVNWERKPLGAVADLCLGKMLDQNKNRGEPLPYLANVNVRWGEFELSDLRTMRFEPKEMDRYGLKFGDIVMCEGGEPGRCAIWKDQIPGISSVPTFFRGERAVEARNSDLNLWRVV